MALKVIPHFRGSEKPPFSKYGPLPDAQNSLLGPLIRGRGGGHRTVYGKMGRAFKPTDSNGSVPSFCSCSWLGTPRAVWGEGEAPGVKGIEDIQARIGDGPVLRSRTFLHEVSFSSRSALEETPRLTISPARTLPLPGPVG